MFDYFARWGLILNLLLDRSEAVSELDPYTDPDPARLRNLHAGQLWGSLSAPASQGCDCQPLGFMITSPGNETQ
jgi:hypothetical protein